MTADQRTKPSASDQIRMADVTLADVNRLLAILPKEHREAVRSEAAAYVQACNDIKGRLLSTTPKPIPTRNPWPAIAMNSPASIIARCGHA